METVDATCIMGRDVVKKKREENTFVLVRRKHVTYSPKAAPIIARYAESKAVTIPLTSIGNCKRGEKQRRLSFETLRLQNGCHCTPAVKLHHLLD